MSPGKVVLQAKPFLDSRTIRLGAGLFVLGVLEVALTMDLPPGWVSVIGLAVAWLRLRTTRPVTVTREAKYTQLPERIDTDPPHGRGES